MAGIALEKHYVNRIGWLRAAVLGAAIAAKAGGAGIIPAVLRICLWGTAAMLITAITGLFFGVNTA